MKNDDRLLRFTFGTLLVAACIALARAQAPAAQPLPVLPTEPGSWVVEVTTRGGFTGQVQSIAVSSVDEIVCNGSECDRGAIRGAKATITSLIAGLAATVASDKRRNLCMDCETRQVTVYRREPTGTSTTATFTWNILGQSDIPDAVKGLYAAIVGPAPK